MQSIPDPTRRTGAVATTDEYTPESDVERAVSLLAATLQATDKPLAYRSAELRAGYHPAPASLDEALVELGVADGYLRDFYGRTRYSYLRDGYDAVRIIDAVTAELTRVRAQLVDEIREDEIDRAERVEELLHRLAEAGVVAVGPAGGSASVGLR